MTEAMSEQRQATAGWIEPAPLTEPRVIPADRRRHPSGCPDADWCRGNRVCYWACAEDGELMNQSALPARSLSVVLWRAAPAERWAVVRWQDGPMRYVRIGKLHFSRTAALGAVVALTEAKEVAHA